MKSTYKIISTLLLSLLFVASYGQELPTAPENVSPIEKGAKVPTGTLVSLEGKEVKFDQKFAANSVVVFYRGGWCPYCNVHLAELQTALESIEEAGYKLIAVSPDSPENLAASVEKNELDYELYADPGLMLAQRFGIVFKSSQKYIQLLDKSSGGTNPGVLPVPAVFVVDANGVLSFVYTNADYKTRLSGAEIIEALSE